MSQPLIPIVIENELIGILTCGQVLIHGKDDLFYERVLKQTGEFGLSASDVNAALEQVPVASGEQVLAAARLLMLVAERQSEKTESSLDEARSRHHQQVEIAEAMAAPLCASLSTALSTAYRIAHPTIAAAIDRQDWSSGISCTFPASSARTGKRDMSNG